MGEFDANLCDPPCGDDREDSNDDDNRIGYYDDNYYGTSIMPELKVLHLSNIQRNYIENNSFFSFSSGDLDEDNKLSFYIENTGTGQLNLRDFGFSGERPVKIINVEGGSQNYSISDIDQPQINICWGYENKSEFKIYFNGSIQGELTKIKIYLDENKEIPDFEFILVHNDCLPATQLIPISRDESWDTYALKNDDYLITGGATVTVTGEIALVENSDIFVDRGSKLVINGGKLTSTCGSLWNGVDIWGNASLPQISTYQGMVQIINGGTIEFAKTAISTSRINGIYTIPSGGIVSCCDAIFKDNMKDVEFYPFTNTHPVTHAILPNFSRFTRTRFETTDDLHDIFGEFLDRHLAMDGVGGIYILACIFENLSAQRAGSRGIGIESNQSGYCIGNACKESNVIPCPQWQPCQFNNLDYGIRAFNGVGRFAITVDSADFIDNYRGIYMCVVNDASIIKNRFELNADAEYFVPGDILVGLYTDRCTRYQIEENKMTGRDHDHFDLFGMQIVNSGAEYYNEIYNNKMTNLDYGIVASGENRDKGGKGLCIKCNDFADCDLDVAVIPDGGESPQLLGIGFKQGDIAPQPPIGQDPNQTVAAGNTFSTYNSTEINYSNDPNCNSIQYTYHGQNPGEFKIIPFPTAPPQPSNHLILRQDNPVTYIKSISCPSNLSSGSINLNIEEIKLLTENNMIQAYLDTLIMNVDGGDTPLLQSEVQTSVPGEALLVRQELIDQSPYLSDTVIITAIQKEDVLPNAMIRDVLTLNPQSAKNEQILNRLSDRLDPMPEYMIDEIKENENIFGPKEILEQKIVDHKSQLDISFAKLCRYYKNDTINRALVTDSLDSKLHNLRSPDSRFELLFNYLNDRDSTNLFSTLNDIPISFELTSVQVSDFSLYEELTNILVQHQQDSVTCDTTSFSALYDLSMSNAHVPSIFARNFLDYNKYLSYNEPIYYPSILKTFPILKPSNSLTSKNQKINVFPNPCSNYFILEYDASNNCSFNKKIELADIQGRTLHQFDLPDNQNQLVIPVTDLPGGIYLIRLILNDQLTETVKVSISK